jgi:2-polyprenyl-3-methyl-5-hydroxy-6-metoxy-1,4-benzoquinol methylase
MRLAVPPSGINSRRLQPEIMDQPVLDTRLHRDALRGLERINLVSRTVRVVWSPIRDLARQLPGQRLRILDIASGAGDVPIGIWRMARRHGLVLDVEACDISPAAVEFARQRADRRGADVRFFQLDAVNGDIPGGYDIVTCSLFLHHLTEDQAIGLLDRMASTSRRMLLVSDLVRCPTGWMLARLGTQLLSACHVVRTDGLRSVEGAFTVQEAISLAHRAGLAKVAVSRHWPCRFLLIWRSDDFRPKA